MIAAPEIFKPFLMHIGNFCPTIKALKRSIKVSLEALIFMSMVYLNDFSGAANLGKDESNQLVKNSIELIIMPVVKLDFK